MLGSVMSIKLLPTLLPLGPLLCVLGNCLTRISLLLLLINDAGVSMMSRAQVVFIIKVGLVLLPQVLANYGDWIWLTSITPDRKHWIYRTWKFR